jgi:ATP-dependent Clp protease ATP-binding subunit ClpB
LGNIDLAIEVTTAVLDRVAEIGYDPVYGARPLKRAIQNWLENPLAQQVLKGDYVPGDIIEVDLGADGELSFTKAARVLDAEAV